MTGNDNKNKPTILIYYNSQDTEAPEILKYFLWGMEEEGVPGRIKALENEGSVELAYEAALQSRLEVGIGIGRDGRVALHNTKLPPSQPLFLLKDKKNVAVLRSLGTNAARLVKGVPFKSLDPADNEEITRDKKLDLPNNKIEDKNFISDNNTSDNKKEDSNSYNEDQVEHIIKEVLKRLQKR